VVVAENQSKTEKGKFWAIAVRDSCDPSESPIGRM
jgi:hypothetical protein